MTGPRPPLERRYRLLLACYPRAHRAEYGAEMLDVLLAGEPDRRWPAPAAVADLLAGAGRAWLGRGRRRAATGRWSAVAAVLGLILPFALALGSLPMYWTIIRENWTAAHHWQTYVDQQALMLAWAVVLVLAFTRRRRATAVAAWLCAAPQTAYGIDVIATDPAHRGQPACWPVVMLLAATALTAVALRGPGGDPRGAATLAVRRLSPVATALLLVVTAFFAFNVVAGGPFGLGSLFLLSGRAFGWGAALWVTGAVVAVLALVVLAALARRAGPAAALRAAALGLALGILFVAGGRIHVLLVVLGAGSVLAYEVVRWFAVPALAPPHSHPDATYRPPAPAESACILV